MSSEELTDDEVARLRDLMADTDRFIDPVARELAADAARLCDALLDARRDAAHWEKCCKSKPTHAEMNAAVEEAEARGAARGRAEERADVLTWLECDAEVVQMGREFMRQDDGRGTLDAVERAIREGDHVGTAAREEAWRTGGAAERDGEGEGR